jgi:transposase
MTKKPFSQDKWTLNFENPTLANGWDKNKETDNTAIILRQDGRYYLGVMEKKNNTIFKKVPQSTSGYEKMVYKLFPDPAKMMPKVCFSTKGRDFFKPSREITRIYENEKFKQGDTFSIVSMQKLIDFYKMALTSYEGWAMYDFGNVKDAKQYTTNIGEFYNDVARSGYRIDFENASEQYIDKMNNEGKLYLFEIHNKDWNLKEGKQKVGSKNTHTLYFEQVFSAENAENNFIVKLNGEAELFFRPATDESKLGKRLDRNGKMVVKNKRYAKDKMFFHLPVTLNRAAPEARKFNQSINELLASNPDINVMGIDRGEKHLAYLSVINQKGEILEVKSLNKINGIEYALLLEERARNRENARRDWKSIEQIKDLKKGYISNVVREIADLIIKYNAIVVFEDLNMRFKQVRGGIEKSVYQQLEKALIDKLNYLVDKKEIDPQRAGHVLRAYQLTAPFESFKTMGKQTGVLFYTQAEYTSQTDPVSGFRKNVYISNSATVEKIKNSIRKLDAIGWDDDLQSYYIDYNPVNFVEAKFRDNTVSKDWRIYAHIPRIKREKRGGHWETVSANPNQELAKLLELWEFDHPKGDLKEQIFQMAAEKRLEGTKEFDGKSRNFWQSFVFLFNLMLQVRNSTATQYKRDESGNIVETIEGVDFISSPVAPFFTTEGGKYTEGFVNLAGMESIFIGDDEEKEKFKAEFNGDANGAYNIARKGLMLLSSLAKSPEKPDLFITREAWDRFVQKAVR